MSEWKPTNYPAMSPYLICENPKQLITFLKSAFGGVLLRRFDHLDGTLKHAEVRIDDSDLMIGGGKAGDQPLSAHIHLYVDDIHKVFARAIEAGATSVQEPQRKSADDDLRGGVRDPSGTTWWVATQ